MPNSFAQIMDMTCPQCGKNFSGEVWLIVDSSEHPDLLEKAAQGTLHGIPCPECHFVSQVDAPLLLYRPGNDEVRLIFSPAQQTTQEQDQEQVGGLLGRLRHTLADQWQDDWLKQITTVPYPLLSVFLIEGAEAAADMAMRMQAQTAAPNQRSGGGVSIPPGFEEDINRLVEITQRAERDPRLSLQRITLSQQVLDRISPGQYPEFRAALLNDLGTAYSDLPTGERSQNLQNAIDCYREALRFRTPEAAPLQYAAVQPAVLEIFIWGKNNGCLPMNPFKKPFRRLSCFTVTPFIPKASSWKSKTVRH